MSQWRQCLGANLRGTFYSFEEYWTKPEGLVIKSLMHYAKLNNKRLMIIPYQEESNELRSKEEAYFRGLMGSEPEFLNPSEPYACYQAVDSAEIVVSLD